MHEDSFGSTPTPPLPHKAPQGGREQTESAARVDSNSPKHALAMDPVALARDLLRCPSVTPAEGGALAFIESVLKPVGFTVHRVTFEEPGTDPIDNLYARIGTDAPHLMLTGHTDVVPPGDEAKWTHPPFASEIAGGVLYGRGPVDMKSAIACKMAAVLDYLAEHGKPNGSISV